MVRNECFDMHISDGRQVRKINFELIGFASVESKSIKTESQEWDDDEPTKVIC